MSTHHIMDPTQPLFFETSMSKVAREIMQMLKPGDSYTILADSPVAKKRCRTVIKATRFCKESKGTQAVISSIVSGICRRNYESGAFSTLTLSNGDIYVKREIKPVKQFKWLFLKTIKIGEKFKLHLNDCTYTHKGQLIQKTSIKRSAEAQNILLNMQTTLTHLIATRVA